MAKAVLQRGDIVRIGNTPIGIALEVVMIDDGPFQIRDITRAVERGMVSLQLEANTYGIDTSTQEGFNLWRAEVQRRKAEAQKKFNTSTNGDMEIRLRSMEEWWDE